MVHQGFRYRTIALCLLYLFGAAALAHLQQPEPKRLTHTGFVAGSVTFAETRLPARFAEIRLVPKPTDRPASPTQNPPVEDLPTGERPQPHVSVVTGLSDMEGHFQIDGVPAGDYLAAALMPGFAGPGVDYGRNPSEEELKRLIASIPTVHVSEGGTATVSLTMHRGGVISGRLQYSDGSAATGIQMEWGPPELPVYNRAAPTASPLLETLRRFNDDTVSPRRAKTDDQGRYRIFGVSPGKYIVSTTMVSQLGTGLVEMSDGTRHSAWSENRLYPNMTSVFAPGVFRRSEARVFEIRGDEEIADADLKLDPSGLHSVRGKVLAGEDRHAPTMGMIRIKENGNYLERMSMLEPDGSFEVAYLPSGTYTLQIMGSSDWTTPANPGENRPATRQYKVVEEDFIVETHDVVLDDVILVALKPGEKMQIPQ